ncbi:MAG: hypothetical protein V1899_05500 [Planctomycetota bacterium]
MWCCLIDTARSKLRVAQVTACRRNDQVKAGKMANGAHTGQLGLSGLGWLEYFGPSYVPVLPEKLAEACAFYPDVKYKKNPDGTVLLTFGDSICNDYWELESHQTISKLFAPLTIPYDVKNWNDAEVVPKFDFSEMRKGYEHIPALLNENAAYAIELLGKTERDDTLVGKTMMAFAANPDAKPEHRPLLRFVYNNDEIINAFKKSKLKFKGLNYNLESLKRLPDIMPKLKTDARTESEQREMLVGLAAYIGKCYDKMYGRWVIEGVSPVIRYADEHIRVRYAFPFLDAKHLWEEARGAIDSAIGQATTGQATESEPHVEEDEPNEPDDQTNENARRHLADSAIQVAREAFNITLDYSVESVRTVDEILQLVHEESSRTNEKEGLHGIAFNFGAYISYVIDKNFSPGKWKPHSQFGKCTFPFEWNGVTLFPTAWCEKQIFNGAEDSVWAKFTVAVLNKCGRT